MKNKITTLAIFLLSIFLQNAFAQLWERCPNQPNYPGLPGYIGNLNLTPMGGNKLLVASGNSNTDFVLGYYTLDGGNNWTTTIGVPGSNGATSAKSGNYLYMGQAGNGAGNIYHSTDDGATWTIDTMGLPMFGAIRYQVLAFYPFNNGIVAKLEGPSTTMIKLNTDAGWTQITNYPSGAANTTLYYTNGDTLFTDNGSEIFYTIDMGQNWVSMGAGHYTFGSPLSFNANGSKVFLGLQAFVSGTWQNAGIAYSNNSGATWDTIPFNAVTRKTIKFIRQFGNDIYVGMQTGFFAPANGPQERLYHTNDMGMTWNDLTYNLKDTFDVDPWDLTKMNGTLFVTTGSKGVIKLNGVSGINSLEPKLSNMSIYPNPANGFVAVEFNSEKAGNAVVSIVDLQGKTLQTRKTTLKSGKNSIQLNTSSLAPGLYITKVEMENSIAIKKIIVE